MSPHDLLLVALKLASIRIYFAVLSVDHVFRWNVAQPFERTNALAELAKLVPTVIIARPTNAAEAAKLQETVIAEVVTTTRPDQLDERTLGLGLAFIDMGVAAWTADLLDLALNSDAGDGHRYLEKNKLTSRFQQRLADTEKVLETLRESFGLAVDRFALGLGDDAASSAVRSASSTLKAYGLRLRHDKQWRDSVQEAMRRVLVALTFPIEPPKSAQTEVASPEEAALLAQIVEHPDNDALRLRWADLADARHDPRAAFVRAQMQMRPGESEVAAFLLRTHPEWAADVERLGAEEVVFHGGFPEAITISADAFAKNAETLLRTAPIRRLRLKGVGNHLEALLASKWLERILWLDLSGEGLRDRDAEVIAAASSLTGLRALSLENNLLTDDGVRTLWASSSLRSLVYCGLERNLCEPLAERELTHEEMSRYEWVPTALASRLEASLGHRRWSLPSEGDWPPSLEVLAAWPL